MSNTAASKAVALLRCHRHGQSQHRRLTDSLEGDCHLGGQIVRHGHQRRAPSLRHVLADHETPFTSRVSDERSGCLDWVCRLDRLGRAWQSLGHAQQPNVNPQGTIALTAGSANGVRGSEGAVVLVVVSPSVILMLGDSAPASLAESSAVAVAANTIAATHADPASSSWATFAGHRVSCGPRRLIADRSVTPTILI